MNTPRVARLTYPGTERCIGYAVYNDVSTMAYSWVFPQMFKEEMGAVLYGLLLRDKAPQWGETCCIAYADSVRNFMLIRFGEAPEELDEYWKILADQPELDDMTGIYDEFVGWRFAQHQIVSRQAGIAQ